MKEFILGKSLMNVNSVASVLTKQESYRFIKEFTLGTVSYTHLTLPTNREV